MVRTLSSGTIRSLVSVAFLFGMIFLFQKHADFYALKHAGVEPLILPYKALKIIDLGLDSAAAAYLWLGVVQNAGANPERMPGLIATINKLDPRFSYPYAFAVLVFPDLNLTNEALAIGKRGIELADPDWRIPYYMATNYHIFLNDRKNAAVYFDVAANMPGAPDSIKRIGLNYGASQDFRQQTKEIWTAIYETSDDEIIQERARNYIVHYEIVEFLEKSTEIYKQKYGKYPASLDELVVKKIIKAIPPDPFGLAYFIDSRGKVRVRE